MTAYELMELSQKLNQLCHLATQALEGAPHLDSAITDEIKSRLHSLLEATEYIEQP